MRLFLIPVVNIEFYPTWFLPVLPCLHSAVLCKNPVISFDLASVSPNFPIFFCIKSLMLELTHYIQIHTPSCRVCFSPLLLADSFAHLQPETLSAHIGDPEGVSLRQWGSLFLCVFSANRLGKLCVDSSINTCYLLY